MMTETPFPDLDALTDRLEAVLGRYRRVHDIKPDRDWYMLKLQEEAGELTQSYLALTGRSRRPVEGAKAEVAKEMADVLAFLLLMARAEDIDLRAAVEQKWLSWEAVMAEEALG
ncbi:phosphoribosyl-ATP pyrophosphohydrolase [Asticcacaulis sp. 201]|uniref:phosphoribosyl-ATP pyrophosphohydrolase n=1 Tax=Asticcacaulis sp. 201 TaxID=3028787 RepID=UPI002915E6FF|nr:phosphoribosyl-ATP pyrophosphohydrolase [Asticcacaulis sp. 201]MDV6332378.1 phosphoribosyl-ATP pyrophosphohydrolase [Asticcacaulis sp. 201]